MKIKKILSQHRRDFAALMICGHCGFEREERGYDDCYFHNNVIPEMICLKCGKKGEEDYQPYTPVYPEGMRV